MKDRFNYKLELNILATSPERIVEVLREVIEDMSMIEPPRVQIGGDDGFAYDYEFKNLKK